MASTGDEQDLEHESSLLSLQSKRPEPSNGEYLVSDSSQSPLIIASPRFVSELATPRLPPKRQWRMICRAAIKRLVSQGCT